MKVTPPMLTILIGTWNRRELLEKALSSILDGTRLALKILVADAGSTDGTVDFLRELAVADERVEAVFEGERKGQAAALNALCQLVTSKYVCWLSDDNQVVGGALDIAVHALEADHKLGMVGLKVRDLRGPFVDAPYIGGISVTGVININQGVLPTALMREVGGFSECFRDYGIDADLTTKILLAGRSVVFTREVSVLHERGWPEAGTTEGAALAGRNARYHRLYALKYRPVLGDSLIWTLRRAVWRAARALWPSRLNLDAARPLAGFVVRDWHNMIVGRFVSPLTEVRRRTTPVYLRQVLPTRMRSASLPADPDEATLRVG